MWKLVFFTHFLGYGPFWDGPFSSSTPFWGVGGPIYFAAPCLDRAGYKLQFKASNDSFGLTSRIYELFFEITSFYEILKIAPSNPPKKIPTTVFA